jgi:hypothetical protein
MATCGPIKAFNLFLFATLESNVLTFSFRPEDLSFNLDIQPSMSTSSLTSRDLSLNVEIEDWMWHI